MSTNSIYLGSENLSTIKTIEWNNIPTSNVSRNINNNKISTLVKNYLPMTKYSLGGAAVFASIAFTATPLVVVGLVSGLAFAALGCHTIEQSLQKDDKGIIAIKKLRIGLKQHLENGKGYTLLRKDPSYSNEIFTDEEFNIIFSQDMQKMSYSDFRKKHGADIFFVLDEHNRVTLRKILLDFCAQHLTLIELTDYLVDLKELKIPEEEVKYLIIKNEVKYLINKTHTYVQFISRNGPKVIEDLIGNPEMKTCLRTAFFTLPYSELTSSDYKKDRLLLSIPIEEINFILKSRLNSHSLNLLIKNDFGFLKSVGKEISKEEWQEKALIETKEMSIKQMSLEYAFLFQSQILSSHTTRLNGSTIEQCLLQELEPVNTLEQLMHDFPTSLFETGVLHKNMDKIKELVMQYILKNLREMLLNSSNPTPAILFIEKYQLISDAFIRQYQECKTTIIRHQKHFSTFVERVKRTCDERIENKKQTHQEYTYQIALATLEKKEQLTEIANKYENIKEKIKSLELRRIEIQKEYNADTKIVSESNIRVEQALSALKMVEELDSNELNEEKLKLNSLKKKILENSTYSKIKDDISVLAIKEILLTKQKNEQDEISQLSFELDILKKEIIHLKDKISTEDFASQKKKLQNSLIEAKNAPEPTVTGLTAALGAIGKKLVGTVSEEEKAFADMIKEEKLLQEKEELLQNKTSLLMQKKSSLPHTIQNGESLTQCRESLKQLNARKKETKKKLKNELKYNQLKEKVLNLEHKQQIQKKIKNKRLNQFNIENNNLKQKNLHLETLKEELIYVQNELLEKNKQKTKLLPQYESIILETKEAEEKQMNLQVESEKNYAEIIQRFESERAEELDLLSKQEEHVLEGIVNHFQMFLETHVK